MKLKTALWVLVFVMAAAWPGFAQDSDPCADVTLDWISTHVPLTEGAQIVQATQKYGLCEVVLAINGELAPIYTSPEFVIAGRMFHQTIPVTAQTMNALSDVAAQEQERQEQKEAQRVENRQTFFKENAHQLKDLVSFSFGPGQAKDCLYVVTDPNCSHCKDLLPKLEEVAFEEKLTLKVIVYPVLGQASQVMARAAICQNLDYQGYKTVTLPEKDTTCDAADERIQATIDLMVKADVSFVPIVVAGNGAWVVEGDDIDGVKTELGLAGDTVDTDAGQGCSADSAAP